MDNRSFERTSIDLGYSVGSIRNWIKYIEKSKKQNLGSKKCKPISLYSRFPEIEIEIEMLAWFREMRDKGILGSKFSLRVEAKCVAKILI